MTPRPRRPRSRRARLRRDERRRLIRLLVPHLTQTLPVNTRQAEHAAGYLADAILNSTWLSEHDRRHTSTTTHT